MEVHPSPSSSSMEDARSVIDKLGETFVDFQSNACSMFSLSEQWKKLRSEFSVVEAAMATREKEVVEKEREIGGIVMRVENLQKEVEFRKRRLDSEEKKVSDRVLEVELREEVVDLKNREMEERNKVLEERERKIEEDYRVLEKRRVLNDCVKVEVDEGVELKEFEERLKLKEEKIKERVEEFELKEKKVNEGFLECQRTLELKKEELVAKHRGLVFQEKKLVEQCETLELKTGHMIAERKELDLKEKELDERVAVVEMKEKEVSESVRELELKREEIDDRFREVGLKEEEVIESSKEVSLMKEEVERKEREMNERFRELEQHEKHIRAAELKEQGEGDDDADGFQEKQRNERCRGLELRMKGNDERFKGVQLKEKEMSEGFRALELKKKEMNERYRRLELKEKEVGECLEAVNLREKLVNCGVEAIEVKVKQLEDCSKGIELKQIKVAELRENRFNEGFKALEVKAKELDSRETQLNSCRKALELREQSVDERCQTFESKEKQINEGFKALEVKAKELDSRERQLNSCRKALELREQSLDERCQTLGSKEKQINEHCRNLWLKEKKIDERFQSLECKEKELNKGFEALELEREKIHKKYRKMRIKEKEVDARCQVVDAKEAQLSSCQRALLDLREQSIDESCQSLGPKENPINEHSENLGLKEKKKDELCESLKRKAMELDGIQSLCINMDAKGLRRYLVQHVKEFDMLKDEVMDSLRLASDPAKLVLNVIQSLYEVDLEEVSMRNFAASCIFLLVQLVKVRAYVSSYVKDEARKFTNVWRFLLEQICSKPSEIFGVFGYLQYLASFKLAETHPSDELLSLFQAFCDERESYKPEQISFLCDALGLKRKIEGLIRSLISRDKHLQAIRYICVLKMEHAFSIRPLLEAHLVKIQDQIEGILKIGDNTAQDDAAVVELTALKEVLKCIYNFKLESSYSPDSLELRIKLLEKTTAHMSSSIKRCLNLEKERVEEMAKSSNPSFLPCDTRTWNKRPANFEEWPNKEKHPRVNTHHELMHYYPSGQPAHVMPHGYAPWLHQSLPPPCVSWPDYHSVEYEVAGFNHSASTDCFNATKQAHNTKRHNESIIIPTDGYKKIST